VGCFSVSADGGGMRCRRVLSVGSVEVVDAMARFVEGEAWRFSRN
jgi:hypothetical protein